MANAPRWPDGQDPGLLIGEAAGLLGISAKAIRVYHDRGVLPEAPRDASGYRRYGAAQLVGLARITRLRAVGLSLREIAPLVDADDGGTRLRQALGDLDAALAAQVRECEQRRALLALVLDEGIDDPVAVSVADVWEERSVALLRRAIPDLTPEQELLERRFARALAALMPDTVAADDDALVHAGRRRTRTGAGSSPTSTGASMRWPASPPTTHASQRSLTSSWPSCARRLGRCRRWRPQRSRSAMRSARPIGRR